MIGEDSSVSEAPGRPTSTGQVPWLAQAAAASASASGGSSRETNAASVPRIVCVEASAWSWASRRSSASASGVLLTISTVRRQTSSVTRSADRLTSPATGSRVRSSAPVMLPPAAPSGVSLRAPGKPNASRSGASSSAPMAGTLTSTSRSIASCQVRCRSPPTSSASTAVKAGSPAAGSEGTGLANRPTCRCTR
jgi:hypothetical protein